jgi:hypothetical protein
MEMINQVTQQTAASAEESAAAASELSNRASEMNQLVGTFVLTGNPVAADAPQVRLPAGEAGRRRKAA